MWPKKDVPSKFESFENQRSNILNEITTFRSNMDHLKEEMGVHACVSQYSTVAQANWKNKDWVISLT